MTKTDLQWKKFPVLNDGFVCLVDVMGDDAAVVQAARVSYGKDARDGEKKDDRGLIRYMMRHHHGTPFEMAEVKLLVRVPMDCWRQWIRHRTANVNEYSTRYSEAIDSQQTTKPDEWRLQSGSNKQGSDGFLHEWPDDVIHSPDGETSESIYLPGGTVNPIHKPGQFFSDQERDYHEKAQELYQDRLACGIAREQARKDLPLSTYTEAYWKCDLRNILHFLRLRMDSHAQKEIRDYATVIGEQIIKPLFPICWEAFEDYQLGSMTLSRLDIEAAKHIAANRGNIEAIGQMIPNKREREECITKLERLGLL